MPISLLRKAPPRRKPDEPVPTLAALSFPSAQPLIDTDAWSKQGVASDGWSSYPHAAPHLAPPVATHAHAHQQRHSYNSYAPGHEYSYNSMVPRSIPIPSGGGGGSMSDDHGTMNANGLHPPAGAALSTSAPARARIQGPGQGQAQGANGGHESSGGRSRAPSQIRVATGASPDFHRPFSPHMLPALSVGQGITRAGTMRRARQRRQAGLTVIVAGPSGSGKTW